MVLQNTETIKKDGIYKEVGVGATGYAKVVIYKKSGYRCRHIYYKPGDGLTYKFTEEPVYYAYKGSHFPSGTYENSPKIAYLKEIRSKNRKICFEYKATPRNYDVYKSGVYRSMGRKIFTKASFCFFYGKEEFSVAIRGLDQYQLRGFTIYNDNTKEKLSFKAASHVGLFNNHRNFTQKLNRKGFVYGVVDQLGRETKIDYYPYNQDNYTDTGYIEGRGYHLGQSPQRLYIHSQVVKQVSWFNGRKTRYEYVNKYFDQSKYNWNGENLMNLVLEEQGGNSNLLLTGRDCYANYMLKKRTGLEGNNVKWIEEYSYYISEQVDDIPYNPYASKSEGLITSIRRSDGSGRGGTYTTKEYSQYSTRFYNKNTTDHSKTIKLVRESSSLAGNSRHPTALYFKKSNSNIVYKSYYEGTPRKSSVRPRQYLYDGNFRIKTLETSKYGTLGKNALVTNYSYGDDDLIINNSEKISITKYKEIIDPSGIKTRITYKNMKPLNRYSSQLNDEHFIYKLYLPERKYRAGNPGNNNWQTISNQSYQYDNVGRLKRITDNLRSTYSTFSYNPDKTLIIGSRAGLLSSKTDPQGVVTTLQYKKSEASEVFYGKMATYYGSVINTQKLNTSYPFMPRGKQVSGYGGPVQSVKTEYNKNNDLICVVDENGYFSVYKYDEVGRLSKAILPGGFFDGSSCGIGQLGYGNYKNIKHYNFGREQHHMVKSGTHPVVNNSYVSGGGQYYKFKASASNALSIPSNMVKAKLTLKISSSLIPGSLPGKFKLNFIDQYGSRHHSKIIDVPSSHQSHSKYLSIDVTGDLRSMKSAGKLLKTLEFEDIDAPFAGDSEMLADIIALDLAKKIKKQRKFLINGDPKINIYDHNVNIVNSTEESISYKYYDNQRKVEVTQQVEKQAKQKELITTHIFDAFGNQVETKTSNKTVSRQGWDVVTGFKNSSRVYQTDYNSYQTRYYYDINGRVLKTLYADGSSKETEYRLVTSSDASLCRAYNAAKYYEVKIDVDEDYNKSSGWNIKKGKTYSFFDKAGNLVEQVRYPEENKRLNTTYEYDCKNRLVKVTTPENISTTYGYDQWGNINSKSSPDFGTYTYRYDRYGNLKYEKHNSESKYIYHIYDKLNRLLKTGIKTGSIPSSGDQAISSSDSELVLVNNYDLHRQQGVFTPGNPNYPSSYNSSNGNHIGRLTATAYRDQPGQTWKYKLYKYDERGNANQVQVCE